MTEEHSEVAGLKVVSVGRDGKRRYDRQTKQKLVEACLEPGASIAGLALKHGVNANLLHKWIRLHQRRLASAPVQPAPVVTAFVPVVEIDSRKPVIEREAVRAQRHDAGAQTRIRTIASAQLTTQMPNGVTLKFECSGNDVSLLSAMIETLGRYDVPAR